MKYFFRAFAIAFGVILGIIAAYTVVGVGFISLANYFDTHQHTGRAK